MKPIPALIAALLITGIIAAGMFIIGGNALFNNNTVPTANSPAQAAKLAADPPSSTTAQAEVAQLQSLVSQYQAREKQYQSQLNQLEQEVNQSQQQLNQANQQVQQFESLLTELQNLGLIRIGNNGQIFVRGGF
jgi:peptidoglycan hydrolase CwlO-like protein